MPLLTLRRRRHLTSALPLPLPIATSAPHPANVSSGDIDIGIDLRRLSPHPDGIRLVLELSVVARLRLLAVSPSSALLTPLDSSTLHCTRRAPPQTRSLAARGHGHVPTTLQRSPRCPAPTRTFSFSRVASAATPLATAAAAALAGPAPSLALSPRSCRSF
jgi:hypothetical protein